jgi:thiol-disulfide isomerase/thioredoxin
MNKILMPSLHIRLLSLIAIAIGSGVIVNVVNAAETDPDGRLYQSSADPSADVRQALGRAEEKDTRALVVLGANWCHDSRALASRLHQSPLAELVQEHYELVFVDVGYLDKGRDLLNDFNVAHFYATPTVLIIDPSDEQVVNNEDRHIWGNAYSIDMPTSVQYFEKWATSDAAADTGAVSTELRDLYEEIDRFEGELADRVDDGYAVVGPMLEAYKAGNEPEDFDARWNELRDFRISIPGDIQDLRDEAERRVSAGEADIELEFPEYPSLSWESG